MKVAKKHICLVVTRICTILVMLGCVQTINAGTTEMTYDAAGNLLTKLTAELKKSISDKGCITYTYDHERLKEVLYPKNLFNRVTYTYGAPGDKYNRAGRIALIEDASGGEAYYYGRMGEVVKTVRTVMASAADIRTYVYGATYDSWNRVRTMTYPDGEVVTYHYNGAGQVESLTSNKLGKETTIVEQIGYDELGHTVYTKLGNGAETTYAYDKQRQRLQEMNLTASGNDIMRNSYQYDAVDNILGISNDVTPTNSTKLGGASSHTYQYDRLNRLISATGNAKDASYTLNMAYNVMSMPLSKEQITDGSKTAQSYHNYYKYEDSDHPSAPSQIGHEHYTYDANGNPTRVENDSTAAVREMYWDEDNRLMVLSDNGKTSRYTYNHAGDRIVKSHGDLEGVYINGAPQGITFHEHDEFTLYPASIISVNKNRFTKHYFIGDKRIASKLGSGRFNNVYGRNGSYITAGQQDYAERLNQIELQREEYYKELGIPPGVPTMKGAYGEPENTGIGYNTIITELGDHSVPKNWEQYVVKRDKGETPGPPIIWSDPQDPEDAQPGYGFIADDTNEEETFFYHSDHLGSTSYITDQDGNITQYTAYLPYGELLVDEHSSSEELPYKFNGKELDEETGLYYYGARYLNPISSVWYGIDPLFEKYPDISAYCYTLANPVRFIDPDGMDWEDINGNKIKDHSAIKVYIFYDKKAFSKQTYAMYHESERLYGKGSVALSDASTMKNFAQDWKNMKSDNIKEVNLNYHGSNQALHLDYQNNQYITATGNGYTNTQPQRNRVPAFNVQDLPMPIGNISHAQLNINSCKSNSTTQKPLLGNGKTLMKTFSEIFNFQAVRGTSVGVSYGRFDLKPHPKYFTSDGWFKSWEYIGNPISIPAPQKSNINDFLYYKTGGRK